MSSSIAAIHADYGLSWTDAEDCTTAEDILMALEAERSDESAAEKWKVATLRLKFYHGTSWDAAQRIVREGFKVSEDGCLGRGVYVARRDKALRFAKNRSRHGGEAGGLVTAVVSFEHPKFVSGDDDEWQYEGYDACRTDATSASEHMEWCLKELSQLRVIEVEHVPVDDDEAASGASVVRLEPTTLAPSAGGGLHLRWRCTSCGEPDNLQWRNCSSCGKPQPLEAIGTQLALAEHALGSESEMRTALLQQPLSRVAFRVGH